MDKKVVCKYCGEKIDAQAHFCPVCGAVNKILSKQDPEKKYCRFCGGELDGTEEYCKICGTPVKRKGENDIRSSIDSSFKGTDGKKAGLSTGKKSVSVPDSEGDEKDKKEDAALNFLQKAAIRQQEDAEREEAYEKKRIAEMSAFREENEKLRASATRAYGNLQSTQVYDRKLQSTQIYGAKSASGPVDHKANTMKAVNTLKARDINELEKEAAEAGVSVDEILLFEQAKANFESDNETYPDDYNVDDYDQFEYAKSRYGSYNIGSLEFESMAYQNQDHSTETEQEEAKDVIREPKEEKGVIGVKKKKTPLSVRILVFFIAIAAVAGLAAVILYIVPMMRNVHPEEIIMDESIDTGELTITPIVAATSTPTPTLTPTPTMTPTPTVDAIIPQSITPTPIPTDTPIPTPTEEPVPEPEEEEEVPEEETEEVPWEMEEIPEETEEVPWEMEEIPEETEEVPVPDPGTLSSGYLVEDSDSRIMDPSELDGRSPEEVRLIANEIYARYGYTFRNEYYANYFSQFDWYVPSVPVGQFSEDVMSQEAQANLDMIADYEAEHGY